MFRENFVEKNKKEIEGRNINSICTMKILFKTHKALSFFYKGTRGGLIHELETAL